MGKKRVERLMREKGIAAQRKRRFRRTTDSNRQTPIAPNVLELDFTQEAPNQAWVTDVTYIFTAEGWLYLAVMLDLFSRRVVGWATSDTNDRFLALDALPYIKPCAPVGHEPAWYITRTVEAPTRARTTARPCVIAVSRAA